ncbi:hypothetical protein [Sphingosinithalassobacter portus]|uniref:hypothetical protein n=1 Tax=Stakelama portus TaxID=2676234 RepID=UPI001EFD9458|nr:hypothetical protein [Sphingosinithalassobacter portus]
MEPHHIRDRLEHLINAHGETYASVSRLLGRNAAYFQQFMRRGTPERLDEDDRLILARYFQVDERELGARDPWIPTDVQSLPKTSGSDRRVG